MLGDISTNFGILRNQEITFKQLIARIIIFISKVRLWIIYNYIQTEIAIVAKALEIAIELQSF